MTRRRRPRRRPEVSRRVRRRLVFSASVLALLLCGIGYRAYSMQVVHSDHYRTMANRQHLRTVEIAPPRGPIYDRRGVELAVTADATSVWANPREILDVGGTADTLAEILGIPALRLEERLVQDRYFVWVERHIDVDQAEALREVELPGVGLTKEPRRYYPGRDLAGPVLGFASIDGRGLDGVELSMNELLRGRRGHLSGIRGVDGRLVLPETDGKAERGHALTLTLDRAIQFVAERALEGAVTEHAAKAGVAIVLEIGTGDVLAMANYPSYDPNQPETGGEVPARNRAITDAYEIGSIMKLFSIAAALEAGVVTPDTRFDVYGGRMRMGGRWIRDSFHDKTLTVSGIIKRSSNIGAIQVAQLTGARRLHDALVRYRFGQRTGIELAGERAGLIRPAARWGKTDLAVISYGYGITATPLQAVAGVAAIANGGMYTAPRLIREVRDPAGRVAFHREVKPVRVMDAEVAAQMMKMMGSVFDRGRDGGTARSVDLDGFSAGGKTGTSRKIDPATGAYGHLYLSSIVGVAPLTEPRIAVLVAVDEPTSGHYYGATVAGGAFARIVDETLRYLGVPSDREPDDKTDAEPAPAPAPAAEPTAEPAAPPRAPRPGEVVVPDFRGLGIAGALAAARDAGIEVEIRGTGRVVRQSIEPGPTAPSALCRLTLRQD